MLTYSPREDIKELFIRDLILIINMTLSNKIHRARTYIISPRAAFKRDKKRKFIHSLRYLLLLSIVFAVLGGFISTALTPLIIIAPQMILFSMAYSYIYIVALIGVFSFWLHLWVYALGGKKGLPQTMKTVFYAATPMLLVGWVASIVFVITAVWSLILTAIGLRETQKMKRNKSILAVTLAFVVGLILILYIFYWIMAMIYFSLVPQIAGPDVLSGGI
jgi:hypothetical protein